MMRKLVFLALVVALASANPSVARGQADPVTWLLSIGGGTSTAAWGIYRNRKITTQTTLTTYSEPASAAATGFDVEMQYWPLFAERWGVGAVGDHQSGVFS